MSDESDQRGESNREEDSGIATPWRVAIFFLFLLGSAIGLYVSGLELLINQTEAMNPTLEDGRRVVVSSWRDARPGDMVVFEFPTERARSYVERRDQRECVDSSMLESEGKVRILKRLVATGGQTISFRGRKLLLRSAQFDGSVGVSEQAA